MGVGTGCSELMVLATAQMSARFMRLLAETDVGNQEGVRITSAHGICACMDEVKYAACVDTVTRCTP